MSDEIKIIKFPKSHNYWAGEAAPQTVKSSDNIKTQVLILIDFLSTQPDDPHGNALLWAAPSFIDFLETAPNKLIIEKGMILATRLNLYVLHMFTENKVDKDFTTFCLGLAVDILEYCRALQGL